METTWPRLLQSPQRSVFTWLATVAAAAVAYYLAARLGYAIDFTPEPVTSALWPPTGLALAALLLLGYRVWPGLFLGALFASLSVRQPLLTAVGIAAGNTLANLTGAVLLQRLARFDHSLSRVRDVLALVALGGAVAGAISATFGTTNLALAHLIPWSTWGSVWRSWWIGAAMGVVLVAPLLLTWVDAPRPGWTRWRRLELAALFALLTLACGVVFFVFDVTPDAVLGLEYAVLPFIVWSALRFTQRETASAAALVAGLAIFATLLERGPFAVVTPVRGLLLLQLFMTVTAATGFLVGAVTNQRRTAEEDLRRGRERVAAAEKLGEEQARLAAAERLAHLGSWEWDVVTGEMTWSRELYEIYGLDPGAHPATLGDYFDRVHPDDRQRVRELIEKARQTGGPFTFTARTVRADGAPRTVDTRGDVISDAGGAAIRVIGTAQDVTEKQLAEASLLRQTALQETLLRALSQIGDGIALSEGEKLVYANDALARLYGRAVEELYGLSSFLELLAPESRGVARERLRRRGDGQGVEHSELTALRPDGARVDIEYAATSVTLNGRPQVFSIVRDVTQQKRVEATRRRLAEIVESAEVAIIGEDLDGTVKTWNRGAERLYGFTADEIVGRSIMLLLPAERQREELDLIGQVLRGETVDNVETVRCRKDGSRVEVLLTMSPIRAPAGETIGVSKITRDISGMKEARRAIEASLAEKEVLLKEIHHRVKNNLQIISSMLNLQSRHIDAPAAKEVLRESDTRVRAIALVHESLYQAKSLASIPLEPYLRSLTVGLMHTFGTRRAIAVSAPHLVLGIDTAIPCGLIVNELVSNALKHAFPDDRPGCITVSAREEGSRVHLEVADDGVGMPPGLDFRNATSMGLQLVSGLTQQLRGELELAPGTGTRFGVHFPRPG